MAAPPERGALATSQAAGWIVFAALAAIALTAWLFLLQSAAVMERMSGPAPLRWYLDALMAPGAAAPYLASAIVMWIAMMLAMMTPAAGHTARLFLRLDHGGNKGTSAALAFAGGYLLLWIGYGAAASLLQWGLHRLALLGTGKLSLPPAWAGWLLMFAGVYQLSSLKQRCLRHCQSPLGFLLGHWRPGLSGALRMGAMHGGYCLGCCWALMLLMFAGGVMSLATMALLSALILAERLLPAGVWSAQAPGLALLGTGGILVFRAM